MTEKMKEELNKFNGYITESEVDDLINSQKRGDIHPFVRIVSDVYDSSGNFEHCKSNTIFAINEIKRQNPNWLIQQKEKVLSKKDYTISLGALGEIRCYGYILNVFGKNVKPIPVKKNKTPDFSVTNGSEKVIIEVNTLQMNGDEAKSLKAFHAEQPKTDEKITIREKTVFPYGGQKADCISLNAIHKICQVKAKEGQFSDTTPTILWIDVQSDDMDILSDRSEHSSPIFTGKGIGEHEEFFSNELWYAVYGVKGMPVFEGHSLDKYCGASKVDLPQLKHNGRFFNKNISKADAIIFSFPNSTGIV